MGVNFDFNFFCRYIGFVKVLSDLTTSCLDYKYHSVGIWQANRVVARGLEMEKSRVSFQRHFCSSWLFLLIKHLVCRSNINVADMKVESWLWWFHQKRIGGNTWRLLKTVLHLRVSFSSLMSAFIFKISMWVWFRVSSER